MYWREQAKMPLLNMSVQKGNSNNNTRTTAAKC